MVNPLPADKIASLLNKAPTGGGSLKQYGHPAEYHYKPPPQFGPVKWSSLGSKTLPCISKGCGCPTNYRIDGIAYCIPHAFNKLSDMIIELRGTQLPEPTVYPNGGRSNCEYVVHRSKLSGETIWPRITCQRYAEMSNYFINVCIRYIEQHGWDYAVMIDEANSIRYEVTREVVK